jgi:hypothetical protein
MTVACDLLLEEPVLEVPAVEEAPAPPPEEAPLEPHAASTAAPIRAPVVAVRWRGRRRREIVGRWRIIGPIRILSIIFSVGIRCKTNVRPAVCGPVRTDRVGGTDVDEDMSRPGSGSAPHVNVEVN